MIIVDLETIGHDCAADFIPAPDLDNITAAKNLKDPAKVAEDIQKRREAAVAEYAQQLGRAALDWNLSRIVAIGTAGPDGAVSVTTCPTEADEALALRAFWAQAHRKEIVGFCSRTFDAPTLIQRSRLLGVAHPWRLNLSRYGRGDVTDLRDLLTFDDARYEAIMPRSLKVFCRRFGIPVHDPIGGAQIPELVAAGDWAGVVSHVISDVQLTYALAARLGVVTAKAATMTDAGPGLVSAENPF